MVANVKTVQHKTMGVTLLEVLLVLAIASSLLVLMLNYSTQKSDELRRDKTVVQVQQILNAGMSFYLSNSYWPLAGATITSPSCDTTTWTNLTILQPNYIPNTVTQPYGFSYLINCSSTGGFYVYIKTNNATNAAIIAGRLPMAYRAADKTSFPPTACTSGTNCTYVVASVSIPGQNLNNARSVNFAARYYSGSCVPAPNCPPNMSPSILVMPAAVAGTIDLPTCTKTFHCLNPPSCTIGNNIFNCTGNTYPVTDFMAYATGDASGNPVAPDTGPYGCQTNTASACMLLQHGTMITPDGTKYWRVCLSVGTQKGKVSPAAARS